MDQTIRPSNDELKEREQLAWLIDTLEGRIDYKHKLLILQDLSENVLLTTARITKSQQRAAALAFSAAERWPLIFGGMARYMKYSLRLSVSLEGGGRKETIDLAKATNERSSTAPFISLSQTAAAKEKKEKDKEKG